MLFKTHFTPEAERGENCSFFFASCDAVHLIVSMSCQEKKIATLCSREK